uniref:Uncharacterized protein n=1 Tax=Pseudomonas phage Cygsa01 TaxID=3138529 RepID=A0AAU6W3G1_9VIRU
MIKLSDAQKAKIKELFLESARVEHKADVEHWVYQMMAQDVYMVVLERLPPEDFKVVQKQMEQEGSYPSGEVSIILDQVEIEVFGRIVCE